MNKKLIKVLKRDKKDLQAKSSIVVILPKIEGNAQPKLVNTINIWIYERGENRRREKAFSDDKISEWKILS